MDATLVDAFSHGLKVSTDKNDTSAPHPRFVSGVSIPEAPKKAGRPNEWAVWMCKSKMLHVVGNSFTFY